MSVLLVKFIMRHYIVGIRVDSVMCSFISIYVYTKFSLSHVSYKSTL